MKKLLSLFIAISFFCSCSTSSDSDGNTNATDAPIAPSNLIATAVSATQINLSWTDNSQNETGFKIERRTGTGNYSFVGNVNANILTYSDIGLTPNTTYTYRVYSINAVISSVNSSNELIVNTIGAVNLPSLTTTLVTSIGTTSAISGGSIASDGGTLITAKGVVWSTIPNPSIELNTKSMDGNGSDSFTSSITGLVANTMYYVKAYATNSTGTAYGNELSFITTSSLCGSSTDMDGNVYPTVSIGTQCWSQKNLNVSKYRNGDTIPQVTDQSQWDSLTTGAWCYNYNDPNNEGTFGKLYNWYAVNDPRGLAPTGWHVPSDGEWTTLTTFLGGLDIAGGKMKATSLWQSPNVGATNSSGFTGLPGGNRSTIGPFPSIGVNGLWWSSTELNSTDAWYRYLYYNNTLVYQVTLGKKAGFSVRCIKD